MAQKNDIMWPKLNRELGLMAVLSLTVIAAALLLSAVSQPDDYHDFADQRSFWSVPNFNDVISNIAFIISGSAGLVLLFRFYTSATPQAFHHIRECIPYALLFLSVVAAGFGSTYYHWSPDNDRLMWDRLPIAISIVTLLSATFTDRVSVKLGLWILLPLIILAITSVLYWYWTELQGVGNLNLYIAVQFYSIVLIAWVGLRFPSRYTHGTYIFHVIALYGLAKIVEILDAQIFTWSNGIVSGHTLKHLIAALAAYRIVQMLRNRVLLAR
ncbi:MAG: alkaline phytoceramidase [Nitrosomonas sp.]